ncbi:MAG: hypothetical protein AABX51_01110, partial [Nanoarchaeota archaeon]
MAREILKDTALTALMGLASSLFSYLFLQFLGKSLTPTEFGDFGVAMTALVGVSVVALMYNAVVIQYIAYFLSKSQKEKIVSFSKYSLYAIMVAGLAVFFIFEFFAEDISILLNLSSPVIMRLLGILMLTEFFGTGISGVLNGLQRFAVLGFVRIVYAIISLLAGAGLVYSGFGVEGALIGFIVGSVSLNLISIYFLRK